MPKIYTLFFALIFPVVITLAQEERKMSDNIFFKTLPNGLQVLVVEDHTVPLVTLSITFKAGAINESKEVNGLIGLYSDLMVAGDRDFATRADFNYHGGQLGIQRPNVATTEENSSYHFTLPKENLEAGLNFMNSAVRFPLMSPAALDNEKKIIDDEVKQKRSNPVYSLIDETDHQLWGDLVSRKEAIGDSNVINSASVEMLRSIKGRYFVPNNALLVVGGDVEHADVFKQVEKVYGDWPPTTADPSTRWPIPEFKPLDKSKYFIVASALARTPLIYVYWQGPDTRHDLPATYAADVFSYMLNQNSSGLRKALIQSGLATYVGLGYFTLKHTGPISLIVAPNPARVKECMNEIKRQVALMGNDDELPDEAIENAKRRLEITDVRSEDITTDFVQTLSFWWSSATLDYYFSYLGNLRKVSRADLKRYAEKYIKNQPYAEGLLISPELRDEIKADDFFTGGSK